MRAISLGVCLPDLEASGKLDPERAAEARALYEELLAQHLRTGSRETAEALASADVLAALERSVTRKDFLTGLALKRRQAIAADLASYGTNPAEDARFRTREPGGPIPPGAGRALIAPDPLAPYSSVEGRRRAHLGDAHRLIDKLLADHSANLLGKVRNKAQLENVVRELFDGATGDTAAKEIAGAWRRANEMLRQRFNRAGGDIGFRADWGLPQSHDWKRVRLAGYDAWRAFIWDKLDRGRMVDSRTGQPFTEAKLEAALVEVFDTIRTDGLNGLEPGAMGGRALANGRGDARFLVFRSADDWMAYAEQFGAGSPYDAMVGHIESMARDIAALEILGPNPTHTLEWIKGTLKQSAALDRAPDAKGVKAAENAADDIDRLWAEYRGDTLVAKHELLAHAGSAYRSLAVARHLGSAFLTAASDFAFTNARLAFNKVGRSKLLTDYLGLMRPGSIEAQKMAVRRGFIAEEWASRTQGQSRFLMEEATSEWARRLASGVLRASLLVRHTQSLRWVNKMETLATFTEHAGLDYAALPAPLRGALGRYGVDAAGWDVLRAAPMDTDGGAEWISPHNLPEADRTIAHRFMEMLHEEADFGVPTADLQTRASYNTVLRRGTLIGELGRSGPLMFKSFGISVMLRQWHMMQALQPATAARYAGGLILGTTLMGAVSLQLYEIANGRDPLPMNDEDGVAEGFWGKAILKGGGFGIFGDFLSSAESRTGNGFTGTLAGPLAQDVQRIWNTASASHPERSLVRTVKDWLPGNNLWYTRAAFDRMLADQVEEAINPDVRAARRRLERYAAESGTDHWWAPGETSGPERAPDFRNVFEFEVEGSEP